ncbi:MAG: C39 family peptidase [bacterium]|nr:C39 family peptidase [bacterium]
MRKIGLTLLGILFVAGAVWYGFDREPKMLDIDVEETSFAEITAERDDSTNDINLRIEETDIELDTSLRGDDEVLDELIMKDKPSQPSAFNLAVPFTSQAPHANWELPYQEACEEASALMVAEYYAGAAVGVLSADAVDAKILESVDFQLDLFGEYEDTTVEQTAELIDLYFGFTGVVVENPTIDQIKAQIVEGRPVIIPAAGQKLENPFFSGLGPVYHMLVVKGYSEEGFITHDPGTRRGADFVYDFDVLMNAIGDWNNGDPANGAKRVLFTAP